MRAASSPTPHFGLFNLAADPLQVNPVLAIKAGIAAVPGVVEGKGATLVNNDQCVELTGRKKAKAEDEGEGSVAWTETTVLRLWKAAFDRHAY